MALKFNHEKYTDEQLIEIGGLFSGGHFTLMKFTTNFRASFSTPTSYTDVQKMPAAASAREAIVAAFYLVIKNPTPHPNLEQIARDVAVMPEEEFKEYCKANIIT